MIAGYGKANMCMKAEQLFNNMESDYGVEADVITLLQMVGVYSQSGEFRKAKDFL